MSAPQSSLPRTYLDWIEKHDSDREYGFFDIEYDDRDFEVANADKLAEPFSVSGVDAPSFLQQTRAWTSMLEMEDDWLEDGFTVERLNNCLAIATENEDVVVVDPADSFSVWCFCPGEGGDVEPLADSLEQWIRDAEVVEI